MKFIGPHSNNLHVLLEELGQHVANGRVRHIGPFGDNGQFEFTELVYPTLRTAIDMHNRQRFEDEKKIVEGNDTIPQQATDATDEPHDAHLNYQLRGHLIQLRFPEYPKEQVFVADAATFYQAFGKGAKEILQHAPEVEDIKHLMGETRKTHQDSLCPEIKKKLIGRLLPRNFVSNTGLPSRPDDAPAKRTHPRINDNHENDGPSIP